MGKFRKVDPVIWNDKKFNSMEHHGKLSFLFLLTHPGLTPVGAMRGTIEGLAAELKVLPKAFREPFAKGLAKADEESSLVWIPNFIRYNQPENQNVTKAWVKSMYYLPECEMKTQIIENVKGFLEVFNEGFHKAFTKEFGKRYGKT